MDLFHSNTHDGAPNILHINCILSVGRANGKSVFHIFGQPTFQVRHSDAEGMKFILAQLATSGVGTHKELSEALGVHRNTVSEGVRILREGSLRDFVYKPPGPKGASKLKPEAKKLIITTHLALPELTPKALAQRVSARLSYTMSENSVREVLLQTGFLKPRNTEPHDDDQTLTTREVGLPTLWDNLDAPSHQMVFQFGPADPRQPHGHRVAQGPDPSEPPTAFHTTKTPPPGLSTDRAQPVTPRDRRVLKELRQGLHSRDAAALIYTPILNEFDFSHLVASVLDGPLGVSGQTYTPTDMSLVHLFANALGYQSVESFQDTRRRELGPLVGHIQSPDIRTHRRFLAAVGEHDLSEPLMDLFAARWLHTDQADYGVFYVDEHFIPYWGMRRLDYGHHAIRRLAMKGNNEFFINDAAQRPVYLMLTPGHVKLSSILPQVAVKLRALRGMDAEREQAAGCPLTLVVDRGGVSAEIFKVLDVAKVRFITYLKDPNSKDLREVHQAWLRAAEISFQTSCRTYGVSDATTNLTDYGPIRTLGIYDPRSWSLLYAITNDGDREASAVVEFLVNRTGQENVIKDFVAMGINHFPGHRFIEHPDRQVDNPEVRALRQEKAKLASKIRRLQATVTERLSDCKRDGISLEKFKERHAEELAEIEGLRATKRELALRQKQLPKKVSLSKLVAPQQMKRSDFRRKSFLDVFKVVHYVAQDRLGDIVSRHYQPDNVKAVLRRLSRRGAELTLRGDRLHVRLDPLDTGQMNKVAQALCEDLNALEPHAEGRLPLRLVYELQRPR